MGNVPDKLRCIEGTGKGFDAHLPALVSSVAAITDSGSTAVNFVRYHEDERFVSERSTLPSDRLHLSVSTHKRTKLLSETLLLTHISAVRSQGDDRENKNASALESASDAPAPLKTPLCFCDPRHHLVGSFAFYCNNKRVGTGKRKRSRNYSSGIGS